MGCCCSGLVSLVPHAKAVLKLAAPEYMGAYSTFGVDRISIITAWNIDMFCMAWYARLLMAPLARRNGVFSWRALPWYLTKTLGCGWRHRGRRWGRRCSGWGIHLALGRALPSKSNLSSVVVRSNLIIMWYVRAGSWRRQLEAAAFEFVLYLANWTRFYKSRYVIKIYCIWAQINIFR